ncbi:MAG: 50S ribosomal protein L2 [Candidatus Thermoplasmatota archaeon]
MGKRLIHQRRGKNKSPKFKCPSHRFKSQVKYDPNLEGKEGKVKDIIHDPGHTTPLAKIEMDNSQEIFALAAEGIGVGDKIKYTNNKNELKIGNVMPVGKIPEGIPVCNIEIQPGDGGKIARSGGNNGIVVSHTSNKTVIRLPSGNFKTFDSLCKATIGKLSGGGRKDKPFLKAGKKYYAFKSKGKKFPTVSGVAMNAVSHPHGGGGHQHVGKPSTVKRGDPAGRKVGSIAPRTDKNKKKGKRG